MQRTGNERSARILHRSRPCNPGRMAQRCCKKRIRAGSPAAAVGNEERHVKVVFGAAIDGRIPKDRAEREIEVQHELTELEWLYRSRLMPAE